MFRTYSSILLISLACGLAQCSKSSSKASGGTPSVTVIGGTSVNSGAGATQPLTKEDLSKIYFQQSTTIEAEVWYQPTAEPYVQGTAVDRDYWKILRSNLTALFQYRSTPPTVTVPNTLDGMHTLDAATQENWTADQIMALAAAHNSGATPAGTSRFYVYFLDGYFNKGQGSDKTILGVSLGGTNVLAMFKPVIRSTAQTEDGPVAKFVEQSTLVHELGHALGFVNNGVPMTTNYQDAEHGAHSNNKDCVMYWLNEGASDLKQFVQRYLTSDSTVMWGPEVLADAKAISK